jgi:hypothetical protein
MLMFGFGIGLSVVDGDSTDNRTLSWQPEFGDMNAFEVRLFSPKSYRSGFDKINL